MCFHSRHHQCSFENLNLKQWIVVRNQRLCKIELPDSMSIYVISNPFLFAWGIEITTNNLMEMKLLKLLQSHLLSSIFTCPNQKHFGCVYKWLCWDKTFLHMSHINEVQLQHDSFDAALGTKWITLFPTNCALVRCNSNMCSYMQF